MTSALFSAIPLELPAATKAMTRTNRQFIGNVMSIRLCCVWSDDLWLVADEIRGAEEEGSKNGANTRLPCIVCEQSAVVATTPKAQRQGR